MRRKLVADMPVGQHFAFSRQARDESVVWRKTGTRAISRINWVTGEVLNVFYFRADDAGYCLEGGECGESK